ncbi:MAG: outer membrane beta-barrel domain-containing protein [Anaeromyxobacteraceae bacterium]
MTARRLAVALVLAAVALAPEARAQSKADAFAGRIPPVSGQLYEKAGRFEATLSGNLSLNDAFFTKYFGGVKLGYHVSEFLSVSAQAAAGITRATGSTTLCPANSGCRDATPYELYQVPGDLKAVYGLEVAWSPVYGKLNAFSEQVTHFDLSILAGGDLVSYREVISAARATELRDAGGEPAVARTFGGHLGLGVRAFVTPWMALRLEVKDYLFRVQVPNGGTDKKLQSQLFTELGASFFFPGAKR